MVEVMTTYGTLFLNINKRIFPLGDYSIESHIMDMNIENIFSINVITILPGKKNNNILNIIDIY
jgi:hypothetical protein